MVNSVNYLTYKLLRNKIRKLTSLYSILKLLSLSLIFYNPCQYYEHCTLAKADSATCQNGGGSYCGRYRVFKIGEANKKKRRSEMSEISKFVKEAQLKLITTVRACADAKP